MHHASVWGEARAPWLSPHAAHASDFDPNQPFTYELRKAGPAIKSADVESTSLAVEVAVKWGDNTLFVSHESPMKSFYAGEVHGDCQYLVPSELLGTALARVPIVLIRQQSAYLVLLPGSNGYVDFASDGRWTFADLIGLRRAHPSLEVPGGYEVELPPHARARMEPANGGIAFEVSTTYAARAMPAWFSGARASGDSSASVFGGLSLLLHLGVMSSMAFLMPKMNPNDAEDIDRDQLLMMRKVLATAADREQDRLLEQAAGDTADDQEGGTSTRAEGEKGSLGNPNVTATKKRYGVQGPSDTTDPYVARQAALKEARDFGLIGLLNARLGGDPNAPTAPWGRDDSRGIDPTSARGSMWGDAFADVLGHGALGVRGVDEGGGGPGAVIDVGSIGMPGPGPRPGTEPGSGSSERRLTNNHIAKPPSMTVSETSVSGRLPREEIQRIVRQNFGRFRFCYDSGLRTNPNLQGRVIAKFVIDRSGGVATASDGGSDLLDKTVVDCVIRGFQNLSFPPPAGGVVSVVFPIVFSPSE